MEKEYRTVSEVVYQRNTLVEVMSIFFVAVDFLLVLRILFKLIAADAGATFIKAIYTLTDLLVMPFSGMVGIVSIEGPRVGMIFEPAVIMAIVIFEFIAWIIMSLVKQYVVRRVQA